MNLEQYAKRFSEQAVEPKQMALFYGESFSGKTHAVAQFARKYKLIWLDLEKGAVTLVKALPSEFHENVTLVDIKDTPQNPIATNTVIKLLRSSGTVKVFEDNGAVGDVKLAKESAPYIELNLAETNTDTILVIDSLTALGDSAMNHYLGTVGELNFKNKEYSHYDHQGLYLTNVLTAAQRLPCHVIFITHQEELKQEDGSNKLTPVGGTRNFARKIARKFDHTIHCKVHNRKHTYNSVTTKDHRVIAGSRLDVDVTDQESLLNLFKGGKNQPVDTTSKPKPTNPMIRR